MRRRTIAPTHPACTWAIVCASCITAAVAKAPAVSPPPSEKQLQEVVVSAEHAGPALWKVTSGQHRLWVLAEPPRPLPATFVWRTKQVEAAIGGAQELILDGGITFNSLMSARPLSAATYQAMRKIPAPLVLKDVIPEDLYRRFEGLKDTLAAHYDSLEQLRPWAAGFELNKHALRSLKLSDTAVSETVLRLGWRAKVITLYMYADYAEFEKNSKNARSVSCLEEIVSGLEADRDDSQKLEDAWSVGDLEVLREAALRQESGACVRDMFDNDERARYVIARHAEQWLAAVDTALRTHDTTFALVPANKVFAADGWLTALRARGYDVQEPH